MKQNIKYLLSICLYIITLLFACKVQKNRVSKSKISLEVWSSVHKKRKRNEKIMIDAIHCTEIRLLFVFNIFIFLSYDGIRMLL